MRQVLDTDFEICTRWEMIKVPIPKKIKVGGFDYEVCSDEKTETELRASNYCGMHSLVKQTIQMSKLQTPQGLSDTFIHECMHAVNTIFNNSACNEETINSLSHGLLQILEQLGIRFVLRSK